MDHWILWPVFVLLNGSAAAISLVSGTVVALSHTELEDLRRRDAQAAVSLERSRGDQGNTLAAFEVLIAAFVGMSALLGGILVGGRFLPDALAGGAQLAVAALAIVAVSFFMAWLTVMLPRKVGIHFRVVLAPRIAPTLSLVRGAASILRSFGKLHDSLAPPVETGVDQADADIGSLARAAAREGEVLRDFWLWRVDANGRLTQSIHAQEARLTATEDKDGKAFLRVALTEARMESRAPSEANRNAPAAFAMAKSTTFGFPAGTVFQDGGVIRKLRWLTLAELLEAMEHGWQVTPATPPAEVARSRMQASTQLMSHLASAFSIFTLSLLAVPLAVRVGRSETFVNAVVALLVALSYYLLTEMAKSVKDPAFRPDLLVWLPNLIVLALAVDPEHVRRGVATRLLAAEARAAIAPISAHLNVPVARHPCDQA